MKAPKFSYVRAESVEHVLALLEQHGDDARVLAGGQSLMPTVNMRLQSPGLLIDINRLDALAGIALDESGLRIGALTRHVETLRSPLVAEHLPLVAEAMPHIAHVAVRNRGTFGGSIALADPAAELPACALALGATFALESTGGRREVAAENFFHGLFETELGPGELLTEVRIPPQRSGSVSAFMELAQRHGDFAMAGLAASLRVERGVLSEVRLVYFASEDRPTLARTAMAAAEGSRWTQDTRRAVADALAADLEPMENLQGSSAMKLHLQQVLTGRAIDRAVERAA